MVKDYVVADPEGVTAVREDAALEEKKVPAVIVDMEDPEPA